MWSRHTWSAHAERASFMKLHGSVQRLSICFKQNDKHHRLQLTARIQTGFKFKCTELFLTGHRNKKNMNTCLLYSDAQLAWLGRVCSLRSISLPTGIVTGQERVIDERQTGPTKQRMRRARGTTSSNKNTHEPSLCGRNSNRWH